MYGYWDEKLRASAIRTWDNIEYNFMLDDNKSQTLVFVHNHPNNSLPSISDIFSLLAEYSIKAIVAVGNNGDTHYVVKTSQNDEGYTKLRKVIHKKLRDDKKFTLDYTYNKLLDQQDRYYLRIK